MVYLQCEAPKIAKLVNITPITMVYGTQITIVTGAYKATYNWGASHCTIYKREMIRDVSFIQRNIMGIWYQIPFVDWLLVEPYPSEK